ncbi:MAG TPA: hypothetical protein GX514_09135 [Thermoanaerobacterales bacterium]|nr:hypothetical protein [Thermoanaerobacterales bacterium]
MAENTSVGSIQLDVEINQRSLYAEIEKINKAFRDSISIMLNNIFRKNNDTIRKSINEINSEFRNISKVATSSSEKASKALSRLTEQYEKNKMKIEEIRKELAKLFAAQDEIIRSYLEMPALSGMTKEETIQQLLKADTRYQSLAEKITKLEAKLNPLTAKNKELADEIERARQEAEKMISEVSKGSDKATRNIRRMSQETKQLGRETQKTEAKAKGFFSMLDMLDRSFRRVIRRIFVLNVMYRIIRGFINFLGSSLKTNEQFAKSLEQIKTNLKVAFQPVYDYILPAINRLIQALATATHYIASAISALFGKSYRESFDAAKRLNESRKAMEGYGKAAKKAAGSLAAFDEINVLALDRGAEEETGFEMVLPDQPDRFDGALDFFDKFKARIKELVGLFKEGFVIGVGGLEEFQRVNEQIKESIRNIQESLKSIFGDSEVLSSIQAFEDALALNLGKLTGAVVSIGQTIAANLIGGISRYLQQNEGFIKDRIVSVLNVKTEITNIIGDLAVTLADIFSVFRSGTAQQITADIIGIFANAFLGITDLATKLGRDIVDLIATPIIQNRDKIKTAFENMLRPISTVISAIKDTVTKAFEKMNEVYDAKIRPLFESLKNGISDTFSKLLEVYNTYFAPVLDRLAQKASTVIREHLQPLLNELAELFGKVAQALKALWENWTKPFIDWIIATILPVVAPILEGLGMLLLNLIQVAIDVATGIVKALSGIIDFLIGVFSLDLEKAIEGIKGIFEGIVNIVETVVNAIVDFFKWLYDILVGHSIIPDLINRIVEWFNNLFKWATDIVGNLVEQITGFFANLWDNILTKSQETWNNITNFLSETWNGIKTKATEVFDSIKTHLSETWNNLKLKASETWGNMKTSIISTVVEAKEKVGVTWNNIKKHVLQRWDEIQKGIANTKNRLVNAIKEPFIIAKNWLSGIVSDAFSWGKNLIDNFIDGIKSMAHKVGDAVSNVAGGIKDLLGFSSPTKKGPGKDADKWMPNLIDMLAEGIRFNIHKITAAASVTAGTIQQNVQLDAGALAAAVGASVGGAMSQALASARTTNESGYGNTEVVIKLNEIELGRAVIKSVNTVQAMAGKTLILA